MSLHVGVPSCPQRLDQSSSSGLPVGVPPTTESQERGRRSLEVGIGTRMHTHRRGRVQRVPVPAVSQLVGCPSSPRPRDAPHLPADLGQPASSIEGLPVGSAAADVDWSAHRVPRQSVSPGRRVPSTPHCAPPDPSEHTDAEDEVKEELEDQDQERGRRTRTMTSRSPTQP